MAARHVRIIKGKRIYTILIMVEHRNLYESRAARLCDRGIWPRRLSLPTSESVIRDVKPVRIDSCSLGCLDRQSPLETGTKIRAVPVPENMKEKTTFNSVLMMFGKLICIYVECRRNSTGTCI